MDKVILTCRNNDAAGSIRKAIKRVGAVETSNHLLKNGAEPKSLTSRDY